MAQKDPNQFVQIALDRMKDQGLRLTQPRKKVVEALAYATQPLSPYRIHDQIVAQGDQVDIVSIYRTVATLDSLGLIHFVHSADGYMPCGLDHHEGPGSEHAVCDDCGKVIELGLPEDTAEELRSQLQSIGFQLRNVRVEIEGKCDNCAEDAPHA